MPTNSLKTVLELNLTSRTYSQTPPGLSISAIPARPRVLDPARRSSCTPLRARHRPSGMTAMASISISISGSARSTPMMRVLGGV